MENITASQLKKILSERSAEELVKEIVSLFTKIPQVKEYYTLTLSEDGNDLALKKYKEIITNEFFPKRGYGKARLSIAKKGISDFKKISNHTFSIIDIMLHYVEQGCDFTNQYGDIDENFYSSMEIMFEDALELIKKNTLSSEFQKRCKDILDNACEGWGFRDTLDDIYHMNFNA